MGRVRVVIAMGLDSKRWVIRISFRSRRIERAHVGAFSAAPDFHRATRSGLARNRRPRQPDRICPLPDRFRTDGVVASGQNQRALEHTAERCFRRLRNGRRAHRRVIDQVDVDQSDGVKFACQVGVIRFRRWVSRHVVERTEWGKPYADLALPTAPITAMATSSIKRARFSIEPP